MSYKDEKEAIIDVTKGGRCYYLTVRLLVHPLSFKFVYIANKLKIHPNHLSLVCAFFSILCLYLFYAGHFLTALMFYYIRTVFDYADGALARYSSKLSNAGKWMDRFIDEIFYSVLWVFIALKTGSIVLGSYFLASALIYRLIVDLFIWPRITLLKKRAVIKQFFIKHGIILGCGVFTVLEFWVLFIFSIGVSKYFLIVPTVFCNLDLIYRSYEIIRYGKEK